ncbi:pyruvate dehydrogenase complex dihydrolipoamide acetyltransferase [Brucella anthropi]|jgi:pyruvate dehydrogenase E2 component (dihydrolipoamide acetyltransferase)|uniref:Acetyltransferase component of pyruvate dehydrogenase complex n=3 Tax=Brucella anthropi TaxID=529 RepID=A0A6I0D956_BRUAN|nr:MULTISPECIES: pyruvate dehydrogenase complex dihydrolipoamide acetyltransferase [Brucella/Ochrobactrum group]QTN02824.1 pyruvate dehydrogenase complex dihydrolipoamide acetyltransferase [Ochrobactrum sp. EEELCW01]KAB2738102.1 pyruvate dehydrogenase complex dihydrolipoamide acetyltransferase [Brucella anthropi]KAB2760549.1 pyruvate dehydrogenase complex dihydrolipoamide acetyltransferase [Brucella anthropi]KAB2771761.1 pyruvate dehydrogenase complex dihydrolipoamide acetyltransferase [Brucell
MPINITMPALSPTMEEGNLSKWLVKEGDKIAPGDVIAEIETDKATMEVEAVDEGTIAKLVVPAGSEGVKVNALIAILAEEGEDVAAAAKGAASAPKTEAKVEAPKEEPKPAAAPAAVPAPTKAEQPAAANKGDRVFASPLARRIAKESGVDIAAVKGTGPHGRVVQRDVEAALASGGAKAAAPKAEAASAAAPKPMSDETVLKLFEEGTYEIVPHDGMRKTIARRLVESKQTVPHFYLTIDCELDALLALRSQINAAAPMIKTEKGEVPAYKLSVNDLVIKAVALALRDIPEANVSWTEGGMVKHKRADVGVAVSIPGGLITPIVRQSDSKTLSAISNEMKDLAKRARDRKLKPEEYQGGSTSVSNLGMFGVKDFAAIINPPHATIFAIGAGEQRAVVKNGEIKVATVMSVTLSTDHRAVDGALAAELAQAFKRHIENPMGMLV